MKKFLKILENISLGLFVNGSFTLVNDEVTIKAILITIISLYAMIISLIFQEDWMSGQDIILTFSIIVAISATIVAYINTHNKTKLKSC